ncbi:hypothetical protein FACS189497_15480 [Betaproteobacteria bacterium]|nr:hypothetical protein FACS189497_15480 [Betaproteobacteria bacterium]
MLIHIDLGLGGFKFKIHGGLYINYKCSASEKLTEPKSNVIFG